MDFSEYISLNNNSHLNYFTQEKCLFIHQDLIKCLGDLREGNKQQKDPPNNLSKCQKFINDYYSCIQKKSIILSLQKSS